MIVPPTVPWLPAAATHPPCPLGGFIQRLFERASPLGGGLHKGEAHVEGFALLRRRK